MSHTSLHLSGDSSSDSSDDSSSEDSPVGEMKFSYNASQSSRNLSSGDLPKSKKMKFSYNTDQSSHDLPSENLPKAKKMKFSYNTDQSANAGSSGYGSHVQSDTTNDDESNDDEDESPKNFTSVAQKIVSHREENRVYNSTAEKMMQRMGYKEGLGLGKNKQGIVDPVSAHYQRGRTGFGLHVPELDGAKLQWDFSLEEDSIEETPVWLEPEDLSLHSYDTLKSWMKIGPKKMTIDDETQFCKPEVLKNMLKQKDLLDSLDDKDLLKARTRANPFEIIRNGIFMNRAAMKMANIDKVFDFMFTQEQTATPKAVLAKGLVYFADICAGPGGFSEYILWRLRWRAKGFGMTLKEMNDFKLQDFYAGNCETFEPHYGVNAVEGDGDIYSPENRDAFLSYVMDQTDNRGLHFVVADGGFSVEGQEDIQEILSKELYLCQSLLALKLLRDGGNFMCKLFDIFTPFSVGLVYLLYKAFEKICIHKPNTSRPANSERYIICKGKRSDAEGIIKYLDDVHRKMSGLKKKGESDVQVIVPLSVLKADQNFFQYIYNSNNSFGERQALHLLKLTTFARDVTLVDPRQADIKKKCLAYWGVPDQPRVAPRNIHQDQKFRDVAARARFAATNILSAKENELLPNQLKPNFTSVYDWHCYVLGSSRDNKICTFFFSMGRGRVFLLNGNHWVRHSGEVNINLGPDTLVYGELVQEMQGEGRSQVKRQSFHVIDGVILGGDNISGYHITQRHELCTKYCLAVSKPAHHNYIPIRMKEMFDLENIQHIFTRLDMKLVKGSGSSLRLSFSLPDSDAERFFLPGGLLFVKGTKEPYTRHLSRKTNCKYYDNPHTPGQSKFDRDRPPEAILPFELAFPQRLLWWWEPGVCVHNSHTEKNESKLQREQIVDFVLHKS